MNKIPEILRQQLAALSAMPNNDIDLSDIPETMPQQWLDASRGSFYRSIKLNSAISFGLTNNCRVHFMRQLSPKTRGA